MAKFKVSPFLFKKGAYLMLVLNSLAYMKNFLNKIHKIMKVLSKRVFNLIEFLQIIREIRSGID
ncbi:hypothetical protein ABER75_20370 [Niallia taxi]|uniref:hypothetical protein n=1 Tax=Niallia taxi TaxID=2499688 RepID=UPI00254FCA80|nr:hypothetical protein [Niallia taxi]MDK8640462.1 hypothetical protein [Niallia taxi]